MYTYSTTCKTYIIMNPKKVPPVKALLKETKTRRLDLLRWLVASWETSGKRIQMQSPINALAQPMASRSANTSFQWGSGKKWWWWSIAVCCCRTHKPWSKSWMKTKEAEFDPDSRANLTNMNNTVSQKSPGTRVSRISMPRFCILDQLFLFRSAHHKAQQFAILLYFAHPVCTRLVSTRAKKCPKTSNQNSKCGRNWHLC